MSTPRTLNAWMSSCSTIPSNRPTQQFEMSRLVTYGISTSRVSETDSTMYVAWGPNWEVDPEYFGSSSVSEQNGRGGQSFQPQQAVD